MSTATTTPLELVLARLEKVRRSGTEWAVCCPAHDDTSPSLTVREAEDGRVLINCHARCDAKDIVAAVGLGLADLLLATATGAPSPGSWPATREDGVVLFYDAVRAAQPS